MTTKKIKGNGIQYELLPSGMHRINLSEKVIQTFKGQFKYALCGVDYLFTPNLWDRLIPQTDMQENLILQSNATPNVSAYVYLNRPHDFNRMPMLPLGCAVQIHKKTGHKASWEPQYFNGWYLGTSTEHYS